MTRQKTRPTKEVCKGTGKNPQHFVYDGEHTSKFMCPSCGKIFLLNGPMPKHFRFRWKELSPTEEA